MTSQTHQPNDLSEESTQHPVSEIPSEKPLRLCEADFFAMVGELQDLPPLEQISPTALAYIGDAVYELYVRLYYLIPPKHISEYHQLVVADVRAENQAQQLEKLLPKLTHSEQEIVKRGRNAATKGPRRLSARIYQQATSLETLVGYLFLSDRNRLKDLLLSLKELS